MTTRVIPVSPFALTVLGASGDLARRKLYPALWRRRLAGQAPAGCRIVGVARGKMTNEEFRAMARQALVDFGGLGKSKKENAAADEFLSSLSYWQLNIDDDAGWRDYAQALQGMPRPRLFYLAVAPNLAGKTCQRLAACGALDSDGRLVLEKPFGRSLADARALNQTIRQHAQERNIYRIDHYLGKETAQNLMALRFANVLLEPLWNARMIDHTQITVAESIGVAGRGAYYDSCGVARDMLPKPPVAVAVFACHGAAGVLHARPCARRKA